MFAYKTNRTHLSRRETPNNSNQPPKAFLYHKAHLSDSGGVAEPLRFKEPVCLSFMSLDVVLGFLYIGLAFTDAFKLCSVILEESV